MICQYRASILICYSIRKHDSPATNAETDGYTMFTSSIKSEDFIIGKDNFADLQINHASAVDEFYYFYDGKQKRLITL
jgi:hypothetical protein